MSPILYLVIPVALAAFAAAILGLFALANATAETELKERYIRELETEIGKLKHDRDEWKSAWDQCAMRLGVRIGELSEANRRADRLKAESESLVASAAETRRESLGRRVREVWVEWARRQPSPKPSWLVPYDELSEPDKEADRCIGSAIWGDCIAENMDAIATYQMSKLRLEQPPEIA